MSEAIETVRNQLNEFFQGMEKKQKIKIAISAILLLITITAIIWFFTRTEYVVLYNNLEAKQAGEILDTLGSNNIKAKLGATSSEILVAKEDEQRAQVVVATNGLPASRFSFEDAFSNSFMMTSEERTQKFLIAQQNYLASTIEYIPGVKKAVVNLTVPDKGNFVFSDNNHLSKASVFLELGTHANLDSNSINGIVLLVSNAVEGLDPENVTIHGSDGRVLNQRSDGTGSFTVNDQMNLQHVVKTDLENSITEFLSTVYGYGNVVVMANVKLDFDSQVTEIKEFSPPIEGETTGIIRSMQELQQNATNEGVGGAPGTDTNTEDPTQYVENDPSASRYSEASQTINYEINELRRKIVTAQGQVKDITVAVYINSQAINTGSLSDEEIQELQSIISAAAGLDTRVVQVGVKEFNNAIQDQMRAAIDASATSGFMGMPFWVLGMLGALLLAGIFVTATIIKKKSKAQPLESAKEIIPKEELEEIDLELSGSQVKQQIEKMVAKKPEAVAQLLKNWLSEE
ncbi:flagellar basal-body MS-ring/collar protein FliF [Alkaliphilus serpentinus]|uniref:Flagellar M-ring protein n=1 Tax=Alkaliphilus serpentinus TaxID=1482731 RepID=A0A833HPX1_9FIRM|nr:flagellar basal-body MS-ring/collar protein FliF [Alkaliphilus serpentinus]KAB3531388.1 flagellar M-ring protein FliF [Alkaliphilus serpentinus]